MGLERFVRSNLVLVPALILAGYLVADQLPLLVLPLGVGYLTFAALICLARGLAKASTKWRAS